MHTFERRRDHTYLAIHHNSDLSGDVIITTVNPGGEITVNGDDLLEFVLFYLARCEISTIECLSPEELFKRYTGSTSR